MGYKLVAYQCTNRLCSHKFEELVEDPDALSTCPECKIAPAKKIISICCWGKHTSWSAWAD